MEIIVMEPKVIDETVKHSRLHLEYNVGDHVSVETTRRSWTGIVLRRARNILHNIYMVVPDVGTESIWVNEEDLRAA